MRRFLIEAARLGRLSGEGDCGCAGAMEERAEPSVAARRRPPRVVRLQPVRRGGVAQSGGDRPDRGEAHLLASGALVQQIAQASGLLALLVIVTILARRLSVAELGAYGLVASLAGYLLVLRNSVASSAIRAMASVAGAERRLVFSAAAALYAAAGLATGLLIAGAGLLIAGLILDGDLARDARVGGLGLGALTAA